MKDTIMTYSKTRINTLDPNPDDILIEDIAHALSMMTRANGHFPQFFSIAQHSLQCAREAIARHYVPQLCMACLLHDGSEAFLSDITRPVKRNMTMYLQIEEYWQNCIYRKFVGDVPKKEEMVLIKNIDDACLYYEFKHFMDEEMFPVEPVMLSDLNYDFVPMKDVEEEFLDLYRELLQKMEGDEAREEISCRSM